MSIENHQNKTEVLKIVENKQLKLDGSFRDSEIIMFIKSCKNITLKRFQGKG